MNTDVKITSLPAGTEIAFDPNYSKRMRGETVRGSLLKKWDASMDSEPIVVFHQEFATKDQNGVVCFFLRKIARHVNRKYISTYASRGGRLIIPASAHDIRYSDERVKSMRPDNANKFSFVSPDGRGAHLEPL